MQASISTARNNLAITLSAMGDVSGARALQEAQLEVWETVLPPDHPNVLSARHNLGLTMSRSGDLSGAQERRGETETGKARGHHTASRDSGARSCVRIMDPILRAAGDGIARLFICSDDLIFSLPLDALPMDDTGDQRLGDQITVVGEVSFARWLGQAKAVRAEDTRSTASDKSPMGQGGRASELAPMTLCGLALAGANHGQNAGGRRQVHALRSRASGRSETTRLAV